MATEYVSRYKTVKITYIDDNGEIQQVCSVVEGELVCAECGLPECREYSPCYYK